MIYTDGVPIDNCWRVCYCPRCQNQEIDPDAEFCQICGLPLYNNCVGDIQRNIPEHRNKSNARYCKICGLPTIYFLQNVLCPFSEVLKQGLQQTPPLPEPDNTYDRYIEMSIATGNALLTAEDLQEFSEIMEEERNMVDPNVPF